MSAVYAAVWFDADTLDQLFWSCCFFPSVFCHWHAAVLFWCKHTTISSYEVHEQEFVFSHHQPTRAVLAVRCSYRLCRHWCWCVEPSHLCAKTSLHCSSRSLESAAPSWPSTATLPSLVSSVCMYPGVPAWPTVCVCVHVYVWEQERARARCVFDQGFLHDLRVCVREIGGGGGGDQGFLHDLVCVHVYEREREQELGVSLIRGSCMTLHVRERAGCVWAGVVCIWVGVLP